MTRISAGRQSAGFTLIELMIVVVVASILFAIAVPTYQSQIRQSRRTDAKTAVLDLAAREAKYFSLNNTYTNSPANLGYVAASSTASFPQLVGSGYYDIYACPGTAVGGAATTTACDAASATATGSSFIVAAVPVTGTSQAKDAQCQYYAVDNTGTQFASSTTGIGAVTTSTCWQ